MAEPGFWDHADHARGVIDEVNRLKSWVGPWRSLSEKVEELRELAELLMEESDPELEAEWGREMEGFKRGLESLEIRTMLQGEDDHREALLTVQAGAG